MDAACCEVIGSGLMRWNMRAVTTAVTIIIVAVFGPFSTLLAKAQGADEPTQLRAEIEQSEDDAASAVLQDVDDLAENTESAMKNELKKDERELTARRAEPTAVVAIASAVPTLDDSNASIESDIDSLEAQTQALDSIK